MKQGGIYDFDMITIFHSPKIAISSSPAKRFALFVKKYTLFLKHPTAINQLILQHKNKDEIMSKTLIAYYSRRGENYVNGIIKDLSVGNTETVAEKIADNLTWGKRI